MGWNGPMTHRQFLAWQQWMRIDRNRPDRSDYYSMQIAAEIRSFRDGFSDNPPMLRVDTFKLKFTSQEEIDRKIENPTEEELAGSRDFWGGYLDLTKARRAKGSPAIISQEELDYLDKLFNPKQ